MIHTRSTDDPIDFVVTWVDGNDPQWVASKTEWLKKENKAAWTSWVAGDMRFRDWGLLRYWFRGVYENAPWVNQIYFVTCGHVPTWLNLDNPKLTVVRHDEFIPEEYLPTFNSHTIELNLHRIEGLSNQFVYFNDDMYLMKKRRPIDHFLNGLPRDFAGLDVGVLTRYNTNYRPYNAMVINDHFDKKRVMAKHPFQWINIRYGLSCNLKTLLLLPWDSFSAIQRDHLPNNFLKETMETLWNLEFDELDSACKQRFRGFRAVSPWLVRDWQRAEGRFIPCRPYLKSTIECGCGTDLSRIDRVCRRITKPSSPMICLNDFSESDEEFSVWSKALQGAFSKRYPNLSPYEKF